MKIRISGIVNDSIVDGKGIRFAVFVQGCPHHCVGCHNPQTHDFYGGVEYDTAEIIQMMNANPIVGGITLTGGEPFCQAEPCSVLARAAHERGLNVWCYTGYKYDNINKSKAGELLLKDVDVLVDGRYDAAKRTLELPFRGSRNQRLIDVHKTLRSDSVIEYEL